MFEFPGLWRLKPSYAWSIRLLQESDLETIRICIIVLEIVLTALNP